MKLYLSLALVALLFNFGINAARVPKPHLKNEASEEVVFSQEAASESDVNDNVVDNENSSLNSEESPDVTIVKNVATKTVSVPGPKPSQPVTKVVTTVQNVPVQTAPVQTVSVVKSPAPVQSVNVVKTQTPTSKTVVLNQVPQEQYVSVPQAQQYQVVYTVQQPQTQQYQQVKYWTVPQQVVYSQGDQTQQQLVSVPQTQQQLVSVPQTQQQFLNVPETKQVVYNQVPQQNEQYVYASQQPQQLVYTVPQTQQVVYSQAQPQVVYLKSKSVQPTVVRKTVWNADDQTTVSKSVVQTVPRPQVHVTKTVSAKVPNPLVIQLAPSKAYSTQTVLTGAQLTSDVADESSKSDVIAQEAESNYR